jgi:hypothetical protein
MTKGGYLKHKELIEAWADGAEIQFKIYGKSWVDTDGPIWEENAEYRIKPFIPKQGDTVLVEYNNTWEEERVFVQMEGDKYRCISGAKGKWATKEGRVVTTLWDEVKPIK